MSIASDASSRTPPARPAAPRSWLVRLALVGSVLGMGCDNPVDPVTLEDPIRPSEFIGDPAVALPVPQELWGCGDETPYVGGLYQICWPAPAVPGDPVLWNGSFILYGHGYVSEFQDLGISSEAAELAAFATSQGFAFASTSYRVNGLAIPEGAEDIAALATIVRGEASWADLPFVPVLVAGASEGGAVATLAAERYEGLFQGALSTCGPTGDFQRQLNYLGDFNVLFNYFFPSVFADGSGGFLVTPAGVAQPVIDQIESAIALHGPEAGQALIEAQLAATVSAAVTANPVAAAELLEVAGVAVDPNDPSSGLSAILALLRYSVFATNDAIAKLGGRPFDNRWRWYSGSSNDWRLNSRRNGVQRYTADAAAKLAVAQRYQTSGDLEMPYVSLHTTGDEVVELWQQPRYRLKALFNGSAWEHSALPVFRYGHCAFEEGDLTVGLALLMLKVGLAQEAPLAAAMPSSAAQSTFRLLVSN